MHIMRKMTGWKTDW